MIPRTALHTKGKILLVALVVQIIAVVVGWKYSQWQKRENIERFQDTRAQILQWRHEVEKGGLLATSTHEHVSSTPN